MIITEQLDKMDRRAWTVTQIERRSEPGKYQLVIRGGADERIVLGYEDDGKLDEAYKSALGLMGTDMRIDRSEIRLRINELSAFKQGLL